MLSAAIVVVGVLALSSFMFAESASLEPITTLHTVPAPSSEIPQIVALGFNLVMITKEEAANSVTILNGLPAGTKGLVAWPGPGWCPGATPEFTNWAQEYAGNPKLYGFYLSDEPPFADCEPVNLKAEADWVHANMAGIKTLVVMQERKNISEYTAYANGQDFLGLDPYPCWPAHPDYCDYQYINKVVNNALKAGVPKEKIIPVYQVFGGDGMFRMPTVDEQRKIFAAWASLIPNPAFDYAFAWKAYGKIGWKTLKDSPELQEIFRAHNALGDADAAERTVWKQRRYQKAR
jgi:hypothetical protein